MAISHRGTEQLRRAEGWSEAGQQFLDGGIKMPTVDLHAPQAQVDLAGQHDGFTSVPPLVHLFTKRRALHGECSDQRVRGDLLGIADVVSDLIVIFSHGLGELHDTLFT